MKWDGSYLGEFSKNIIESSHEDYTLLHFSDEYIPVILANHRDLLPIFIDEIKPLYCVTKTGTHSIKIGGKRYVVYRVPYVHRQKGKKDEFRVTTDLKLDLISDDDLDSYRDEVEIMLTFRRLVQLNTTSKNLYLRNNDIISLYDTSIKKSSLNIIPIKIKERWGVRDPTEVITTIFDIPLSSEGNEVRIRLLTEMEAIMKRLSMDYHGLMTGIVRRTMECFNCSEVENF